MTMYFKINLNYLRLQVPKVEALVTKDPTTLMKSKEVTKLPGVAEWNLIRLVY